MKSKISAFIGLVLLAVAGCAAQHPAIIVTTSTGLGVTIAENPATQLYEGKIGFVRNEFGYIPINPTNANQVANVMMELRYNNLFAGGGIYQRLAVGDIAVAQPGASLMFAKDSTGNLSLTNLNSIKPLLMITPQH